MEEKDVFPQHDLIGYLQTSFRNSTSSHGIVDPWTVTCPTYEGALSPLTTNSHPFVGRQQGSTLSLVSYSGLEPRTRLPEPSSRQQQQQQQQVVKDEFVSDTSDSFSSASDTCPSDYDCNRSQISSRKRRICTADSTTRAIQMRINTGLQPKDTAASSINSADHQINPEEERKRIRRERNKLAAARCRQRRMDLTNQLMEETDSLDAERIKLEKEVEVLQQQKDRLEFVLGTHEPQCLILPPAYHPPVTTTSSVQLDNTDLNQKMAEPGFSHISPQNLVTSRSSTVPRPNSLLLNFDDISVMHPLVSPSMFDLGLDIMLDGHTGLTPLTGVPSSSAPNQTPCPGGISSSLLNL